MAETFFEVGEQSGLADGCVESETQKIPRCAVFMYERHPPMRLNALASNYWMIGYFLQRVRRVAWALERTSRPCVGISLHPLRLLRLLSPV